MKLEWDPKAGSNRAKHRVSFEEASTAFGDPLSRRIPDPLHSGSEDRWVLMGLTSRNRLVAIVYAERSETTRLISARLATPRERRDYEQADG